MTRVLVAGAGNIFLGDDGFGVEVAARLARDRLPDGVHVEDFGIRGVHLAYTLLDGYDVLILVDAVPRGGEPGTVYVIRADLGAPASPEVMDAHDLAPETVLALLTRLGGRLDAAYVVGCEPSGTEGMGLSEPVAAAVDTAAARVRALIDEVTGASVGAEKEGADMVKRIVIGCLLIGIAVLVVQSMPDIRRYLKIRAM